MRNIIQYIGLTILIVFSFFYTEKTVTTIKNQDPLMIEIEEKARNLGMHFSDECKVLFEGDEVSD